MQPPFRPEYVKLALADAKDVTSLVFKFVAGGVGAAPSVEAGDVGVFVDTLDGISWPEKPVLAFNGWVASAPAVPEIQVESSTGEPFEASMKLIAAADVLAVYPNLKSIRFELKTNCPASECDLVVRVPGVEATKIPLNRLLQPGPVPIPRNSTALIGYVDIVSGTNAFALQHHRRNLQMEIANYIALVYSFLFPKMAWLAAAGLLLATFFRKRFPLPTPLLALGLASAAALATYIALMAYVKATADMNVITALYLSPTSPFVITFTVIGVYCWLVAFKVRRETLKQKRLSSEHALQHITLA